MTRTSHKPTRIDGCVYGRWVERIDRHLTRYTTFTCDALVFDDRWVELRNPTLFVSYTHADEGRFSEQVKGYYRVPASRMTQLSYDLCTA